MTSTLTPDRLLIIRPSALGDVCRTVPVLASLRHAYPQACIDWVVQDDFAPAIEAHPALNGVIGFPRRQFSRWWRSAGAAREMFGWVSRLRKRRYDLVLDCQGLGRSGLMTLATGAPRRIGLRSARELGWLGYNVRVAASAGNQLTAHTVDQMLSLLEGIGIEPVRDMRLYVSAEHREWWSQQRTAMPGFNSGKYAVLAPTTRWVSKRWPIERFTQLIEPLRDRGFDRVMIIGSPSEAHQITGLSKSSATGALIDLVGKTSIGQTMAVIEEADLVVANDSAPLHMAVGLDRPCVGLFGPTDPAVVGPYRQEQSALRGYQAHPGEVINFKEASLGDRLMRFISTASVIARIDRVLADWSRAQDNDRAKPQAAGTRL